MTTSTPLLLSNDPASTATMDNLLVPRNHWRIALAAKRAMDLTLAALLCVVLVPLFVIIAVAIKLESRGPVLFLQKRRGRRFEVFTMIKFRSMRHRAPDPHEHYETRRDDPRITLVGAFLRRTSLDELPQLFNVIVGSMSLVGPRPLVEWESQEAARTHAERFAVRPGITGLCQITIRNGAHFHARLEKDVEYVRHWRLLRDITILLQTPFCVIFGNNVYPDR